ncbi:MAG TPA: hypothetical protein VFG09_03265 [Thermodesulfovibrionales bacterium]|jgi:DNA repair protein RadC|nr:hypothetical protein [Thermodesulfovibrionales bacterium]
MDLLVVFAIVLGIVAIFVLAHLRPLSEDEVQVLADRRRTKAIDSYYTFDRREYAVNAEVKKRMAANGSVYNMSEQLFEFPALAAGRLKYKKHEWIIVAFERNKTIDKMWVNKGPDRSQVHFGIGLQNVQQMAVNGGYRSVLVFHNHPNSDPSLYSTRQASDRDKQTAGELADQLSSAGVNLMEFVCERGRHYTYLRSVCDTFLPIEGFREKLRQVNGASRGQNFSLHRERLFG